MQPYPHRYEVTASGDAEGGVRVQAEGLPGLDTAPPPEFDGPGGTWSPETMLVAAVADCFILTFRAIARASKLSWRRLECAAAGTLDRRDGVTRFTELSLRARLVVPADVDPDRARRLLEKADATCLVTNSLALQPTLATEIVRE
jgi:peroxiredoxin-like protein